MNGIYLVVMAGVLVVVSWAYGNRLYREIWGHSLRLRAWPFVLGAVMFDRRLQFWERPKAWRCPNCERSHRRDWCCVHDSDLCGRT